MCGEKQSKQLQPYEDADGKEATYIVLSHIAYIKIHEKSDLP